MRIYYLHHSAVAAVMDKSLLVFDHYLNENKGMENGSVSEEEIKAAEKVYVFVSHSHYDHFNQQVFGWAKLNPQVSYILDSTVKKPENGVKTVALNRGDSYEDGYIEVTEFGSTDIGGSFYVRCEGKSFFHAGDFNYWHWRDEGNERYSRNMKIYFERELKRIKEGAYGVDYAFFPVDKRMGSGHDEGADMFIEAVKPKFFIPIHMRGFEDGLEYGEKIFEGTTVLAAEKNGQRLI